jgi:hypothetical protein
MSVYKTTNKLFISDDITSPRKSWQHGKCRPLTKVESMEILWTIYPPAAANLAHLKKSRWIRPILHGTEAWSLLGESVYKHHFAVTKT